MNVELYQHEFMLNHINMNVELYSTVLVYLKYWLRICNVSALVQWCHGL